MTEKKAKNPAIGQVWSHDFDPSWSPWKKVEVVSVDLLGHVTINPVGYKSTGIDKCRQMSKEMFLKAFTYIEG